MWVQTPGVPPSRSLTCIRTLWGSQDATLFLTWTLGLPVTESAQESQTRPWNHTAQGSSPCSSLTIWLTLANDLLEPQFFIIYSTHRVSVTLLGILYNNSFNTNNPQMGNIIISSYVASEEIEAEKGYLPKATELGNNTVE